MRPKRTKPRRPPRARRDREDKHTQKALDHRAAYVLSLIEAEPWRDGQYGWLASKVRERFNVSRNPSEKAVTRAYELMQQQLEVMLPRLVGHLTRVHLKTIEKGFKDDGRLITSAATELRKLHGIGEPDRINVTGGTTNHITLEDAELLKALKLTNARRQARIDQLKAELGMTPSAAVTSGTFDGQASMVPPQGGAAADTEVVESDNLPTLTEDEPDLDDDPT